MSTIYYRDMVQELYKCDHEQSRKTCKLTYVKCDRKRNTGGELVTVEGAQKCGLPYHCKDNEMIGIVRPGGKTTAVHLKLILLFNDLQVTP